MKKQNRWGTAECVKGDGARVKALAECLRMVPEPENVPVGRGL